jgi:hypothetical protein
MDFVNNGATNLGNLNLSGGGVFYIGGTTDLGASGTLTLGDAIMNGDPTDNTVGRLGIYGSTSPVSVAKAISVSSAGGGIEYYRAGANVTYGITSSISLGGNLDVTIDNTTNGTNKLVLSGPITGTGSLGAHVFSNGAARFGTVELVSNANTYSGTTTIGGGGGIYGGVTAETDRITLNVNGTHTGGGDYNVNTTGTLGGTGSITSIVYVNAGGTINPGPGNTASATAGVGTLTVGSAVFNTDFTTPGRLLIEYDGAADTVDKLVVTGALNITDALLDFNNLGTGVLNGSPKVFASYGSLTGLAFANVVDLPTDYTIDYDYLGTKQIALVGGPTVVTGDYNSDGKVNAADYVVWRKNPGAFPPDAYDVWRANFGGDPQGAGAGLNGGAVPEPTACGLLVFAALVGLCGRRARAPRVTS